MTARGNREVAEMHGQLGHDINTLADRSKYARLCAADYEAYTAAERSAWANASAILDNAILILDQASAALPRYTVAA